GGQIGIVQRPVDLRVDALNDVLRCAGRGQQADPLNCLEAGKALLRDGGEIGQLRIAAEASARDRTQRASLDLRQRKQRRDCGKLRVAGAPPRHPAPPPPPRPPPPPPCPAPS